MALNPKQQTLEHITRAKRILIVSKANPRPETLASVLATAAFLIKMNKEIEVVIPEFDTKKTPAFLTGAELIRPQIGAIRAGIITLRVKDVPLKELTYDVQNEALNITLIPKHGEWQISDLSFKPGTDRYDLVIALDVADQKSLGTLNEQYADFLYRTTVINIDCQGSNEFWGQINVVDLNAVSTTEILYHLFEEWNRNLIDEPIATALLTGLIASTKSFRTSNVTPKTLSISSQLIAMGARREDIVHGLWRSRDLATLRLWGRALSRMEQDGALGLIWTVLTRQDFVETGTTVDTLNDMLDELISYSPEAKITVLIHESLATRPDASLPDIQAILHVASPLSAEELSHALGGRGNRERTQITLTTPMTIIDGTQLILKTIRSNIKI